VADFLWMQHTLNMVIEDSMIRIRQLSPLSWLLQVLPEATDKRVLRELQRLRATMLIRRSYWFTSGWI